MTVQFPAIQPTDHDFTFPQWPVTEKRSQSGVRSVKRWGDRPSDARMTLSFNNISESNLALIRLAYDQAQGSVHDVEFPPIVFNGITDGAALLALSNTGGGLRWYFTGEPQGNRTKGAKRFSLRIEFRAELRME